MQLWRDENARGDSSLFVQFTVCFYCLINFYQFTVFFACSDEL